MANPFPFVAGEILTAAELNGIGEYTAYTPTFNNLTVGNGTLNFKFAQVNEFVHVVGILTFGSTTSITGVPDFTFPVVQEDFVQIFQGFATLSDANVNDYLGFVYRASSENRLLTVNVASTYPAGAYVGSTVPFTWTTGDAIRVNVIYKAA
jgi:hypothetical protein